MSRRPLKGECFRRMEFVNKAKKKVEDIQGKEWAPKAAKAMSVTGTVINALGDWIPGVGLIGGALELGSSILNPQPDLSDLQKKLEDIETGMNSQNETVRELLQKGHADIADQINQSNEKHFQDIQGAMQDSFSSISSELKDIENDLAVATLWIRNTYLLVQDIRYKQGMEMIESQYQTFLNGSHNLKGTLERFTYFIAEFEGLAGANFR